MDIEITQAVEKLDEIEKAMAGKELGDEIARLRQKAGWTQGELAQRIGLHQTRVSKLESGEHNFPLETIYRLAIAFGVNPFELAAIYWGIEVEDLSNRDKEFLNNLLKLFDEYRKDMLPPPFLPGNNKPPTDISERGDKNLKKATVARRKNKKKIDKPEENPL